MDSPSSELHIGMMQFSTVENTETILGLQKHSLNEELQSIENMEYHAGSRTMLGDALNRVNHKVRAYDFVLQFSKIAFKRLNC
jgi:hypothetical protein